MTLIRSGCISLYDKDGDIVSVRHYNNSYRRREILEKWERRYAHKFKECFYQISPDFVDEPEAKEIAKGSNIKSLPRIVPKISSRVQSWSVFGGTG